MTVRLVVAVTDGDWFEHLRALPYLPEVNFWAPGSSPFRALSPGELFLFKLHSPRNFIVGCGVFAYASTLPCSLAWEAFGEANGASTFLEMRRRIIKYRRVDPTEREDFAIGCRILTQPFFFPEPNWIPVPATWSPNIVAYKAYSTADQEGQSLWAAVQDRMQRGTTPQLADSADEQRYGSPVLVRPRLGQGAFRVIVTDAYQRRCVITGERTLPALEAAHIKPYASGGSHEPTNGLLMRRDIHALFDAGYVTVTPNLRFEVSRRIKEEFENGRDYYQLHGRLVSPPHSPHWHPDISALDWHNQNQYRG
jgi:putative restriction endonuclease